MARTCQRRGPFHCAAPSIHPFEVACNHFLAGVVDTHTGECWTLKAPCQMPLLTTACAGRGARHTMGSMNPSRLANLLGTSSNSIRRWSETFAAYLSPSARPAPGEPRIYTKLDAQILHFVATQRAAHRPNEDIAARLADLRAREWQDLPALPDGWPTMEQSLTPWNVGAGTLAQIAGLQTELQFVQEQRDHALAKVTTLEDEIDALRASQHVTQAELSAKQTELAEARAVVARVEGQLSQYTLGRAQPVNVGVIVIAALAAGAALMLVAFVVLRLAG